MGTPGYIVVKNDDGDSVTFYQHWDGDKLPEIARAALKRGWSRRDDASYLARIVFCEMVKDDILGTSGYGISSGAVEGEASTTTIDGKNRTVETPVMFVSFEDFVKETP